MANFMDRLPMLVDRRSEESEREIVQKNAADPQKDRTGCSSAMLIGDLRFFGVADYLMKGDIESFRKQLSESAQLYDRLFVRFENGEPIDVSYVAMLAYKELFDALAAADMKVAHSLAAHMGGRDAIEKKYDHPFDYAMGYTLRSFVLNDKEQMQEWTPKFIAACNKTSSADFLGYGQVFQAILDNDSAVGNEGMKAIVKGHQKQSKRRGVFADSVDEVLSVWGIGMANLARSHGLQIEAIPPLIPQDLLE